MIFFLFFRAWEIFSGKFFIFPEIFSGILNFFVVIVSNSPVSAVGSPRNSFVQAARLDAFAARRLVTAVGLLLEACVSVVTNFCDFQKIFFGKFFYFF